MMRTVSVVSSQRTRSCWQRWKMTRLKFIVNSQLLDSTCKILLMQLPSAAPAFLRWADAADGWRVILSIPTLNAEIVPEGCKHRVSRGKRVSVTLRKKNLHRTW